MAEEFNSLSKKEIEELESDSSSSEEECLQYECGKLHMMIRLNSLPLGYSSLGTFCNHCGQDIIEVLGFYHCNQCRVDYHDQCVEMA